MVHVLVTFQSFIETVLMKIHPKGNLFFIEWDCGTLDSSDSLDVAK